jgi:tRNA U34 5-methylaminomethyl-2-thiouridine-forming methyltransferase MnmC
MFNMHRIITGDGSPTLFNPYYKDYYHSTFGAITESDHVFIKAGLASFYKKESISVLEIGFGAGLNALLTCIKAMEKKLRVIYHTVDKYPVDAAITDSLNYWEFLPDPCKIHDLYSSIHQAPWFSFTKIHSCFTLHKIQADLSGFVPDFKYDLIYFDAFSPDKQPEMWTHEVFRILFDGLNTGGLLITYCVKGQVKRTLKGIGFMVEKLPGPPGKREILRATKILYV